MNKKLFSWKALAGFALLAAISMTSCNTDDPINPTNPSGVNPTVVVKPNVVQNGANLIITVDYIKQAADSLATLVGGDGKDTKVAKAYKAGNLTTPVNITLNILKPGTATGATDSTIVFPATKLDDKNVNLTINTPLEKFTKTLIIQDLDNLHALNVVLADGKYGPIKFVSDYSNIGLSATAATVSSVSCNLTQKATLALLSGITVTSVKTNSFVLGTSNNVAYVDGATISSLSLKDQQVWVQKDDTGVRVPSLYNADLSDNYYVKSLNVDGDVYVGSSDYDDDWNHTTILDKITIAKTGTLRVSAAVKEIAGTLNNGALASKIADYDSSSSLTNYSTDLSSVDKISNVIIDGTETYSSSPYTTSSLALYAALDNVQIDNFGSVTFAKAVASTKKVTFNNAYTIYYQVPAQESDSYTFTFNECALNGQTVSPTFTEDVAVVDGEGNPIKYELFTWYVDNGDGTYTEKQSKVYTDIPVANRKYGYAYSWAAYTTGNGWRSTTVEPKNYETYDNYNVISAFKSSKNNGVAISDINVTTVKRVTYYDGATATTKDMPGVNLFTDIDSSLYKWEYATKTGNWVLVKIQ